MVTYLAPVAAESEIPVVKCYLNGVTISCVMRSKTFVAKLLGVVSSVVFGLTVGKESPFIQCGTAIGAGLSQGKSTPFNFDFNVLKAFRNDRDKRDVCLAICGGLFGAAFCYLHVIITSFRKNYLSRGQSKVIEAILVFSFNGRVRLFLSRLGLTSFNSLCMVMSKLCSLDELMRII